MNSAEPTFVAAAGFKHHDGRVNPWVGGAYEPRLREQRRQATLGCAPGMTMGSGTARFADQREYRVWTVSPQRSERGVAFRASPWSCPVGRRLPAQSLA